MYSKKLITFVFLMMGAIPLLSSCSQIELASHFGKKITGSNIKSKGHYKVGSPYTIKGRRYYPNVDYNYNKTGVASWYGPGFHGKATANGERFDQNELTAAHKTLPLPSIVRVTNLENGKSLIVRVNDRGPYAHSRIIDMSKRSAELLGFRKQGVAKVRVQVMEAESRQVAQMAQNGQDTRGVEDAMNRPSYRPKAIKASMQQPTTLPTKTARTIPGHVKSGAFYPDAVVSEYPIAKSQRLFVQVASYTTRENAMKLASKLDVLGRAQIYDVVIDGAQYYRVRFPVSSVPTADTLLERIISNGYNDAFIMVD